MARKPLVGDSFEKGVPLVTQSQPCSFQFHITPYGGFQKGSPKSSILIGFSLVNHPFWGTSIYGNPHIAPDAEKTRGQSPQNQTSSLGPGLRHQHLVRPSQLQKLPQMALANICNSFIQSVLRNLGNHIPVGQKSPHGDCLLKAPFFQWEFQDPKMEVLYHIRPYFGGISPYIALKNRPYIW